MDMVERVAKAIETAIDMAQPPPGEDWEPQLHAKEFARAAIEAMREPTEAMLAAINPHDHITQGHVYDEYDSDPAALNDGAPREIWQDMIDAAFSP